MKKVSLILSAVVMTAIMLSSCGGNSHESDSLGMRPKGARLPNNLHQNERLVWLYNDENNLQGTFSKIKGNQWREKNSNSDGAYFIFHELESNEEYILLSDENRVDNTTVYIKLYQDSCLYRTNTSNWVLLYKGSWQ